MPYFTYDTSVCIARNLVDFQRMPHNFRLSAVVVMELMAGDPDESRQKFFGEVFRQFQKENLLIVPNADDWLLAAKVLILDDPGDHSLFVSLRCIQSDKQSFDKHKPNRCHNNDRPHAHLLEPSTCGNTNG